ncbi:MAG: PGPGW domain-containing protein [Patescibacteria group bacterium]
MIRHIKRTAIVILALLFLVFGVIGLFLPFLQGILFIIIGLVLLSFVFSAIDEWVSKFLSKSPKLANHHRKLHQKLRKYFE